MSTCKQAIQIQRSGTIRSISARIRPGRGNTNRIRVYCLLIGIFLALNPAVGRAQWSVDSNYRFGFATAVSGPTLSSTSVMNPAALSGTRIALSYSDEFGLSELRAVYGSISHDLNRVSIGLQFGSFGYIFFNELHGAGSIAFDLAQSRIGMSAVTNRVSVPGYGYGSAVSLRLGTRISVSETLHLGIVGDNLTLGRIGEILLDTPPSWITAISWEWMSSASISAGIKSESGNDPVGAVSVNWMVIDSLYLKLAHEPATGRWALGINVQLSNWSFPFGGIYHSELGWSRIIGMGWMQRGYK
jgi:hypothetical protein